MAKRLAMVRQYEDIHANTLGQHFFLEFIKNGYYDMHLANIRETIRQKRDAMISALSSYCAPSMTWDKPEGGFYLWCKLNQGLRSNKLTEALIQKKVTAIPGTAFYLRPEEGADRIRLAFCYETDQRMEKGIQILGQTAKNMLDSKSLKPDIKELELKSIV
jgi:DNA-binding transcriptional MocR family regulator